MYPSNIGLQDITDSDYRGCILDWTCGPFSLNLDILYLSMHYNLNICVILTTVESAQSSLSSDSCEYYQTEIFDQLPSIQASRQQNTQGGPEQGENTSYGHLSRGPKDKASTQPLKNLVMCIQGKRDARWESLFHTSQICVFSFLICTFYCDIFNRVKSMLTYSRTICNIKKLNIKLILF